MSSNHEAGPSAAPDQSSWSPVPSYSGDAPPYPGQQPHPQPAYQPQESYPQPPPPSRPYARPLSGYRRCPSTRTPTGAAGSGHT